jgi:excisionase family DNA binding protein
MMEIQMLSAKQVADMLSVDKTTLIRQLRKIDLPYIKFGRQYRFEKKDVEEFLRKRYQNHASA